LSWPHHPPSYRAGDTCCNHSSRCDTHFTGAWSYFRRIGVRDYYAACADRLRRCLRSFRADQRSSAARWERCTIRATDSFNNQQRYTSGRVNNGRKLVRTTASLQCNQQRRSTCPY
jgi:hypothetical protein